MSNPTVITIPGLEGKAFLCTDDGPVEYDIPKKRTTKIGTLASFIHHCGLTTESRSIWVSERAIVLHENGEQAVFYPTQSEAVETIGKLMKMNWGKDECCSMLKKWLNKKALKEIEDWDGLPENKEFRISIPFFLDEGMADKYSIRCSVINHAFSCDLQDMFQGKMQCLTRIAERIRDTLGVEEVFVGSIE